MQSTRSTRMISNKYAVDAYASDSYLDFEGNTERTIYHKLMDELPEDETILFVTNGIKFNNREEYEKRVEKDVTQLAQLLYAIYQDKQLSDNAEK